MECEETHYMLVDAHEADLWRGLVAEFSGRGAVRVEVVVDGMDEESIRKAGEEWAVEAERENARTKTERHGAAGVNPQEWAETARGKIAVGGLVVRIISSDSRFGASPVWDRVRALRTRAVPPLATEAE